MYTSRLRPRTGFATLPASHGAGCVKPLCRHCKRLVASRARGLCRNCSDSPARELYPLPADRTKALRVGSGVGGQGRLPKEPTAARPGTEEKIAVMTRRAERGESLFHPDDAKDPTEDD